MSGVGDEFDKTKLSHDFTWKAAATLGLALRSPKPHRERARCPVVIEGALAIIGSNAIFPVKRFHE
jgi:hypothetical protein